ncbi:MAG: oxygen-independent coproporphyrinogen III oxidase, partial [Fibrobacteria bacterium]|nr:oxygen-independent coproporphyrinogen III oxidase [Fibrobacteria bacterium]
DSKSNEINYTIDPGFINKYNKPGPRYTSYPPAPYFTTDIDREQWAKTLQTSNKYNDNISFYFHIPFCPKRCLYCGCTTDTGVKRTRLDSYFNAITKEMGLVLPHIETTRPVSQIHFGGGTPNFFPYAYLEQLLSILINKFSLTEKAEIAIECDPNLLNLEKLSALRKMGLNRISFGLQDFNKTVLKNVNRKFPETPPDKLIQHSRKLGFRGINLDLIYGLPGQDISTFRQTLQKTIEADPDRVAVFGYAHVPWQMPHQEQLEKLGLVNPDERIQMSILAHDALKEAGYTPIGMDHFAKKDDALAIALKERKLHRNFQGYCTKETTGQVYAFGASGISQLYEGYGQNIKGTDEYINMINQNKLPLSKTYFMTKENLFFREVINGLMCRGELNPSLLAERFNMSKAEVTAKTAFGMGQLDEFEQDGIVERDGKTLRITPKGWLVVRCVAMVFDPLLEQNKGRYSKTM